MTDDREARLAAMRRALEGVREVCPPDLWPEVHSALEDDAGEKLLARLEQAESDRELLMTALIRAERDRELLLAASRPFVRALETHEEEADVAGRHGHWFPSEDDDPMVVEISLGDFRAARHARLVVLGTPDRIAVMANVLLSIEEYADPEKCRPDPLTRTRALGLLREEIPQLVAYAAGPFGADPPSEKNAVATTPGEDALARQARDYLDALRRAASVESWAEIDDETLDHELWHALCVELPDIAKNALDEHRTSPEEEDDWDPDDPDSVPF